jgi:hypothetical protein
MGFVSKIPSKAARGPQSFRYLFGKFAAATSVDIESQQNAIIIVSEYVSNVVTSSFVVLIRCMQQFVNYKYYNVAIGTKVVLD